MPPNTPSLTDPIRVNLRAGLKEILDAYKATGALAETYAYPPESYHTPCAYIETGVPEAVTHDMSTRQRILTAQVVFVVKLISNAQATGELDVMVDALHEWVTANPRIAGQLSMLEVVRVQPGLELTDANGNKYAATVITIDCNERLGRQ
jgi:hypothetical protein